MNDIEKAIANLKITNSLFTPEEYLSDKQHESVTNTRNATKERKRHLIEGGLNGQDDQPSTFLGNNEFNDFGNLHDQPRFDSSGNLGSQPKTQPKRSKIHNLPLAALNKAGFITPSTPKGQITEEYRRIKRPLLKKLSKLDSNSNQANNVIAVTSAMSGEGKTFSAVNLAMSLASEKDRTVLLIDADVVRHTAGALFGVSSKEPGLLNLLDGDTIEPADAILRTNVDRLNFLPAGRKNTLANELLSSENMSNLVKDLSNRYQERIIVLDCPPVMQTNEATILVDYADQVVFVVAEEQTKQGTVIEALRLVGNEDRVGILLNKSTSRIGHYGYYSYS